MEELKSKLADLAQEYEAAAFEIEDDELDHEKAWLKGIVVGLRHAILYLEEL